MGTGVNSWGKESLVVRRQAVLRRVYGGSRTEHRNKVNVITRQLSLSRESRVFGQTFRTLMNVLFCAFSRCILLLRLLRHDQRCRVGRRSDSPSHNIMFIKVYNFSSFGTVFVNLCEHGVSEAGRVSLSKWTQSSSEEVTYLRNRITSSPTLNNSCCRVLASLRQRSVNVFTAFLRRSERASRRGCLAAFTLMTCKSVLINNATLKVPSANVPTAVVI